MKKIAFVLLAATVALVSCQKSEKSSPDIRTYGLTGDVREVYLSTEDPELGEEGEDTWYEEDLMMFSFDEQGRVTEDDYGNTFEYDAEGRFAPANPFKTLTRDAQGRIVKFVSEVLDEEGQFLDEDLDVMDYCHVEYTYDAKGRVITEDYTGWEWGNVYTYEYEGDAIYPSKIVIKGFNEGWNDDITQTFEYLNFDAKGNWTSRNVHQVSESYEEPWEENQEPEVEVEERNYRQIRTITYWSDKD